MCSNSIRALRKPSQDRHRPLGTKKLIACPEFRLNDDLRTDQEVQNELHQRLVDLQDQLYDVADGRKEGKKPRHYLNNKV